MIIRRLFFLVAFTAGYFPGKSQEVKITPIPYTFDPALTNIVGMSQDTDGFIWLADNYNGLAKYDGTKKKFFKAIPNDSNSLFTNRLECLFAGKSGIVWIGSIFEGLDRLDPVSEVFTHFQHDPANPNSLCDDHVSALLEDRAGTLWIGTDKGLDTLDWKTGHFVHIEDNTKAGRAITNATVRCIYEDHSGRIWIGAGNAFDPREHPWCGLYQLDKESGTITHYTHDPEDPMTLSGNRIRAIFEDSQGNFYVGTDGDGLHIMNRTKDTFQRLHIDPDNPHALARPPVNLNSQYALDHITFINEDVQGCIWIGTYAGGINRYNPKSKTMEFFGTSGAGSHHLEKNDFWTLLKTRDNLLWISGWEPANENQVLLQISTFQNHFDQTEIENRALVFAQGKEDGVWIGTQRGLYGKELNEDPDSFFSLVRRTVGATRITDLKFDEQDNLWVTSAGCVYFFDRASMSHRFCESKENDKNGLSSSNAHLVLPMKDSNTWVGTYEGLDILNSGNGNFTHHKHDPSNPSSLSSNYITSLLQDSQGRVWIGTDNGLNLYREDSADFKRFLNSTGVPVIGIHEDSQKRIWVSSYRAGFFLLDPESGSFDNYYDNTGLITDLLLIRGVVEDESKWIWLNTDIGFIRLNPETKDAALFGNSWQKSRDAGFFPLNTFISKNGEIFVGNASGYFSFRPEDLEKQYPAEPAPYLAAFYLGDHHISSQADKEKVPKDINHAKEIRLLHHQNTFTLEFGNIDFVTAETEKNLLYKLENYEQNWRIGAGQVAFYHRVPPGEYILHIKATNRYGKVGQRSISIIVMPPWYTRWWAVLCYSIVLVLLLYLIYGFLLNRKLAQAEMRRLWDLDLVKTRLYTDLTHEFRTPLTVISGIADQVLHHPSIELLKVGLHMIRRNSEQLLRLINQMLELSKLESGRMLAKMIHDNILGYLKYLTESFHSFAEFKEIRLHLLTDLDELYMDFDPEKVQAIFSNLLSNAIKFTPAGGNVYIKVDKAEMAGEGSYLELRIKDTGQGIASENLPYIFDRFYQVDSSSTRQGEGTGIGLALTRELVQLMEGTIRVSSQEGKGTEFILKLPIREVAPKGNVADMAKELMRISPDQVEASTTFVEEENNSKLPLALLIENNEDVLSYLAHCLRGKYQLHFARNGVEGIQKAIESVPDIIISDVMMPGKDGFEVVQTLKNDQRTSHIPIILLTAKADIESKLEGLERGADAYLSKPFEQQELEVRLRKLIELRQKLQQHFLESLQIQVAEYSPETARGEVEISPDTESGKFKKFRNQIMPLAQSLDHAFVLKVRKVIEANMTDSGFDVEKLCHEIALSHSQVHRKLSALTGLSATHFIRHVRLVKAKELLKRPWLTISSIAHDSGFTDPAYFSRVFKKEFGHSPQDWREHNASLD